MTLAAVNRSPGVFGALLPSIESGILAPHSTTGPDSASNDMGFRFRRSIKIAPGVRWNLGLRGSSFTFGGRGATLNFSKRGVRATAGIPGTGLSYSQQIGGPRRQINQESARADLPDVDPDTLGVRRTPWKLIAAVLAVVAFPLSVWAGLIGVFATLAIPSRKTLARKTLAERRAQFHAAVSGLANTQTSADVDRVLALPAELHLPETSIAETIDQLQTLRELMALEEAGGQPVAIEGAEDALGSELCYFLGSIFLDKHGKDEHGTVYLARTRLLFVASSRINLPWSRVSSTEYHDRTVTIQRSDRQTPYLFVFDTRALAAKAAWIAEKMRTSAGAGTTATP
jgi:hypothetical protein